MSAAPGQARSVDDAELAPIVALAARLGADPMYVQGGGGNASVKAGDTLWVKASGKWLAHAAREPIFVPVSLSGVRDAIAAGDADPVSANAPQASGLRPSIETTLHALLPQRVVLHLHSIHALAAAVRRDGPAFARERLAGLDWTWVDYARPGVELTRAVAAALRPGCAVILLASHGVVVGADDCAGAEALVREVERRLAVPARAAPSPDVSALQARAAHLGLALPRDPRVHALATDRLACARLCGGALFPDQVVFLGPLVSSADDPSAPYRLVGDRGVLVQPTITAGQEEMLLCLALVLQRVPDTASLVPLDPGEVAALAGWEAERYRIAVDERQRR
jgi:rhamnose utilization protein RhaD (predicted bifunctional aldolase and dehydrogenase)